MSNYFGIVTEINSDDDFNRHFQAVADKPLIIDFFASWCGPCNAIAPKFSQFARTYLSIVFFKVNVDNCKSTAMQYGVTAMPTFVFIQNAVIKEKVKGADPTLLENKIVSFQSSLKPSSSGGDLVPGMVDLEQYIVEKNCLNESEDNPFKNVFEENDSLFLESDCDPELLVTFKFNQKVKLHSMKCSGKSDGHAPKTIKLFINQPNAMDFDSARDAKPVQEIVLDETEATTGNLIPLKFVKLQNVDSVTLFFPDNQGDEETTRIDRLALYGKSVSTTNMGDFKRVAGKKGESH